MMSEAPTYWATSPDAMVETMIFGTPTGSARMAGATMAVPPDPPADSTLDADDFPLDTTKH